MQRGRPKKADEVVIDHLMNEDQDYYGGLRTQSHSSLHSESVVMLTRGSGTRLFHAEQSREIRAWSDIEAGSARRLLAGCAQ